MSGLDLEMVCFSLASAMPFSPQRLIPRALCLGDRLWDRGSGEGWGGKEHKPPVSVLCDLAQVSSPLWVLVSSAVK